MPQLQAPPRAVTLAPRPRSPLPADPDGAVRAVRARGACSAAAPAPHAARGLRRAEGAAERAGGTRTRVTPPTPRLRAALRAALGEAAERRQQLEERAARGRELLRGWDREEDEQPQAASGFSLTHEDRPSPKELEELELLNKALEKALRVRKSILKTPLETQGAAREKSAGEGPAPRNAQEQQAPASVEDVPVTAKVRTVSKNPAPLKKPSSYKLRAPYRTDPEVKKLQRKAPARCVSLGPRTAGKSSSKGVACKQGRSYKAAIDNGDRGACSAAEPQKTPGLSRSALNQQQSFSTGDSAQGKVLVTAGRQLFDAGKKSGGFLGESSRKEDPTSEGVLGKSTSPRTVTLQEKGCQLKLPLPYRKAYSRNARAWERCRLCQTSADAAAARNSFIERIQTTFCSPVPAFSPAEIEEELKVLQDVPSLLSQYVEAEPEEHPTLQREYERLLTLEGLQTTVSQCLHKLHLLQAAVESQMKLCPDCSEEAGSCSPTWAQPCDGAGLLARPLLSYSSLQELRDLFALKLQVSMLHQQIALQKVMMTELLPVLESRPHPEASTAQLYRAIYTLLCEGGKRFPVLVRDELPD
ncbi:tubulin epsilon and delta complex protein 2 [Phaenicophaeus curvirostris]|uniref:tubulin epsilon and delta complex protein 2 n=1 Tax=Phaenicophaeus curvirostris TaxID=33595 RepID=UPI0037F0F09B